MDEQQLKIRGVTHFTPTELPESENRVGMLRFSLQPLVTDLRCSFNDHLCKLRQRIGKVDQSCGLKKVRGVDQKEMVVLEDVQGLFLPVEVMRCGKAFV